MPHPPLLLHAAAAIGWTQWTIHPSTVVGLVMLACLYEWGARKGPSALGSRLSAAERLEFPGLAASRGHGRAPSAERRERSVPTHVQRIAFYAALTIVFLSLNGPLHDLSDGYLFSAHMVQHLLLTLVFPPLLLFAVPGAMLRPLLARPTIARAHALQKTRLMALTKVKPVPVVGSM